MENIKGLRDNPIEKKSDECLGLTDYADSLSEFILICDTPITIAIQGDWGSGKTSMMNMISETIKEKTICIPFNSWQFSQFDLESYLHVTLLNQFLEKIGAKETIKDFTSKVGKWLTKAAKTALVITADKTIGGASAEALKDQMFAGDPTEIIREIDNLKQKLQAALIARLEEEGKNRAVVFIDDLDRLAPEKAVELLEVLKIFLDIDKCVFVLAVDYKVVSQGLKKKFGEDVGSMKGKSFFDKIIQLPFNMPVSRYDADKYIVDILKNLGISYHPEDVKEYRNLIESSIGFNPRSIKCLFNSFLLILSVARKKNLFEDNAAATLEERLKLLFGIQCMQTAWEELYYFIIKNTSKLDDQFFKGLKEEEQFQKEPAYSFLRGKIPVEDIFRMTDFMGVFYNTMQLKSDKDTSISQQEIWNLIDLIQFSSITSRDSSIILESMPNDYNWDLVKSIAINITRQLSAHYKITSEKYPGLKSEFGFWPERWGVNNQHEKFRVFVKFFKGSGILLSFDFVLDEGQVLFRVFSNKVVLKKLMKEIVQSCELTGGEGYQYNEDITQFLIVWKKAVPGYSDETIGKSIFEFIRTDLDRILPLLFEKIYHLLPENQTRIQFIGNLKNRVFNKLKEGQVWSMADNYIEGTGVRIYIEKYEPGGEADGGYGSWWGVYESQNPAKGIPIGLKQDYWEAIIINGVNDFIDFLEGNLELERLEQSSELKEKVLESLSDDIVQKVKTGMESMNSISGQI